MPRPSQTGWGCVGTTWGTGPALENGAQEDQTPASGTTCEEAHALGLRLSHWLCGRSPGRPGVRAAALVTNAVVPMCGQGWERGRPHRHKTEPGAFLGVFGTGPFGTGKGQRRGVEEGDWAQERSGLGVSRWSGS